jgi:predicted CopG family antitoxin
MRQMNERHTITINTNDLLKLRKMGRFGESYSELISRLVDNVMKNEEEIKDESKILN